MSVLIPAWCIQCRAFINNRIQSRSPFLCQTCFQNLPQFDPSICLKCGRSHDPKSCQTEWASHIQNFYSVFSYEDPVRAWISSLKYNRNFFTGRMFQLFIRDWFDARQADLRNLDLVIPIPLHRIRLFNRGFNQAIYLLNKQKVLDLKTSVLRKKGHTAQQAGKSRKERKTNLKNTFQVSGDVRGKKILLFDDVCTTGQTLAEASKALKRAGSEQVDALVLCRSLKVI